MAKQSTADSFNLLSFAAVQFLKKPKTMAAKIQAAWKARGKSGKATPAEFASVKKSVAEYLAAPLGSESTTAYMGSSFTRAAREIKLQAKAPAKAKPTEPLSDVVAEIVAELGEELQTLQDRYDDMSEAAQNGARGEELSERLDQLSEIVGALEAWPVSLGKLAVPVLPKPKLSSRVELVRSTLASIRLGLAACLLALPKSADAVEALIDEADDMAEALNSYQDEGGR